MTEPKDWEMQKPPFPWLAFCVCSVLVGLVFVVGSLALGQTPPAAPIGITQEQLALMQYMQQMSSQNSNSTIAAPVAGGALSSLIAVFGGLAAIRQIAPMLFGPLVEDLKIKNGKLDVRVKRAERDQREIRNTVHWLAQCQTVFAEKLGADLPQKPAPLPEPDSEESS